MLFGGSTDKIHPAVRPEERPKKILERLQFLGAVEVSDLHLQEDDIFKKAILQRRVLSFPKM